MFTCKAVLTYCQIGLTKKGNLWILLSQNVELYLCYLILFNCMSDFTTRFLAQEIKYQKDLDCADYIHHYLKWIWWRKKWKKMKFTKVVLNNHFDGVFLPNLQNYKILIPFSRQWSSYSSFLSLNNHNFRIIYLLNISWVERLCKPWWWGDFIETKW